MSNEVNEMFAAISRPNPVETDYAITNIEGEIPRELNGTLYRNGVCDLVFSLYFTKLTFHHGTPTRRTGRSHAETSAW